MLNQFAPKEKRVIVLGIVFFAGLIVFFIVQSLTFHLTGTNPRTSSVTTLTPFIELDFNRKLPEQPLKITSTPSAVASYKVSGNKVILNLSPPLSASNRYRITIESVTDTAKHQVKNIKLSFTPRTADFNNLPKDQQQALINSQDHYSEAESDPIISKLPYGGVHFSLTSELTNDNTGKQQLILHATIILSKADVNTDRQGAINAYKQEVVDYIHSLGLDPNKYNIQYSVQDPSIY